MGPLERWKLSRLMRREWDQRARENARHYVDNSRLEWTDAEFLAAGQAALARDVLTDMTNICQGKDPAAMRVLEIGCGAGRITRALAGMFGEVHAVDVSGEMIERARVWLAGCSNVRLYRNNGYDLSVLPHVEFDFAYSNVVFQHIPSYEVIENYVREVRRLLRPGGLFKFQVQGDPLACTAPEDTWNGVPFTEAQARAMAERCGFEMRYAAGACAQYFWLWFFKPEREAQAPGM